MGMNESTGQPVNNTLDNAQYNGPNGQTTGGGGLDWGSIIGAGLGAAGSLYAGNQGNKSINNALGSQTQAAGQAGAALAPYGQVGLNAIGGLNSMMSGNYDMSKLPGYTTGLESGEKAINRGLAARGNFGAGGSIPALTKFNQDYAQQQYGNQFNRLSSLLNVGQNAANAQAGIYQGLGNAQGAAAIAANNTKQNGQLAAVQTLANLLGGRTAGGGTVGGQLVGAVGSGLGQVGSALGGLIGSGANAVGDWYNNNFNQGGGFNSDGSIYGQPYTGTGTTIADLLAGGGYSGSDNPNDYWEDYTPKQNDYTADWSQYGGGDETYR
jgi:hypothetical protein